MSTLRNRHACRPVEFQGQWPWLYLGSVYLDTLSSSYWWMYGLLDVKMGGGGGGGDKQNHRRFVKCGGGGCFDLGGLVYVHQVDC